MDRVIKQADKLGDMGEEVSDIRKMTGVKEGLAPKYLHLAHSLSMESDLKWDNLEVLVRSYENNPLERRRTMERFQRRTWRSPKR